MRKRKNERKVRHKQQKKRSEEKKIINRSCILRIVHIQIKWIYKKRKHRTQNLPNSSHGFVYPTVAALTVVANSKHNTETIGECLIILVSSFLSFSFLAFLLTWFLIFILYEVLRKKKMWHEHNFVPHFARRVRARRKDWIPSIKASENQSFKM